MCPCSPNDVSFPSPTGPSGPAIPGFGIPFSLPVPTIPFPDGFPEDLLDIMNKLQMLIPPGALKPQLNPNFGKDIFDGIMKLLDQFMPFLMLYKFFLPILNLIICIIEVLCALMNPFALISALNRLFTQCIPEFLNLFPIFALILMIISLLLLLLQLIIYLIQQVLKFILAILRNIRALVKAFQSANATSVAAIAKKLGALLCIFQNLFVLLALFGIIIQIIKDILSLIFSIPPCEGGGPGSTEGCCAATYCPTIVQNQYTNTTGTFQYLNEVSVPIPGFSIPGFSNSSNVAVRAQSWQLYDQSQGIAQAFNNIVDGYDISPTVIPKPVFFPTDAQYSATTSPQQAAYTMDLRLYYNPTQWGDPSKGKFRTGPSQFIRFKDCIVLAAPTTNLVTYNNGNTIIPSGVLFLAGGKGYLDDNSTVLTGFAADGVTSIPDQATLENFIHFPPTVSATPNLQPTDGYTFFDMQYTFKPNLAVLLQKNLVTLGCEPQIALSRAFVNNVMFAGIAAQTFDLQGIVNGTSSALNGRKFPDPNGAVQCLQTAVSNLAANMTVEGVAEFQAATDLCFAELTADTKAAIEATIGTGFNPCESKFTIEPSSQFTTQSIHVSVSLNENNGLPITTGIPTDIAANLARNIKATPTFGTITQFSYDGYQAYTAEITSDVPGSGQLMIAFQNQTFCTNTLPADGTAPSHTLQLVDYSFVYTPSVTDNIPLTGEGDTTGTQPRRDPTDTSRDNGGI
jgi:hypothetical protein